MNRQHSNVTVPYWYGCGPNQYPGIVVEGKSERGGECLRNVAQHSYRRKIEMLGHQLGESSRSGERAEPRQGPGAEGHGALFLEYAQHVEKARRAPQVRHQKPG